MAIFIAMEQDPEATELVRRYPTGSILDDAPASSSPPAELSPFYPGELGLFRRSRRTYITAFASVLAVGLGVLQFDHLGPFAPLILVLLLANARQRICAVPPKVARERRHAEREAWERHERSRHILEVPPELVNAFCGRARALGLPLTDGELTTPQLIVRYLTPHFADIHALMDLDDCLEEYGHLLTRANVRLLLAKFYQTGARFAQFEHDRWWEATEPDRRDHQLAVALANERAKKLAELTP